MAGSRPGTETRNPGTVRAATTRYNPRSGALPSVTPRYAVNLGQESIKKAIRLPGLSPLGMRRQRLALMFSRTPSAGRSLGLSGFPGATATKLGG